jgi:ribosomal protein L7/L12
MKIEIDAAELMDLVSQQERQVRTNMMLAHANLVTPEGENLALRLADAFRFIRDGDKVGAVKIIRSLTGIGLKEAYDLIDGNLIY